MQPSSNKRWVVLPPVPPEIRAVLCDYPAYLQQFLYNRGLTDPISAADFLSHRPPSGCDPLQMKGISEAVERIGRAINAQESIAVYGDYDVDGVTATVLMVQVLRALGAQAREYIPDRFIEGYGMNTDALDTLKARGVSLVISVDNGIRSDREADYARDLGMDLIITDHHHPLPVLPNALVVIDPKQAGDEYPDKNLSGVGIAYKLAQALIQTYPREGVYPDDWLDLVALGTVADIVPLIGENRYFVQRGLTILRQTRRQGLFSLANVAGLDIRKITASDIGFILGPRLNAAGRLESALAAFHLLMADNLEDAARLAQALDDQNQERKRLTQEMENRIRQLLDARQEDLPLIFVSDSNFNKGVVGLAASHIAEAYHRPAFVAQMEGETTRGSARSIPGFHLAQALDECQDLLIQHGGHAQAAGFTVANENLQLLSDRLQMIALRELDADKLRPLMTADLEVDLGELDKNFMETLNTLQPTGEGNPEPLLMVRDVQAMYPKVVGKEGKHLKFRATDGWTSCDAIAWRQGHRLIEMTGRVDLLFTFELNEFNGQVNFQLNVKDIRPAGAD